MKIVVPLLLIAISGVVGWEIGAKWKAHAHPVAAITANAAVESQSASPDSESSAKHAKARGSLPLVIQLQRELASSNDVTKALYWLAAIEKAQPQDYLGLALLARGNTDLWRVVIDRWFRSSPRTLFDALMGAAKGENGLPGDRELTEWFFTQWAKKDPDAAIAAMKEPGAQSMKQWQVLVALSVVNSDPERGLQLFGDLNIQQGGGPMDGVAAWAAANPQHAAEFTITHPAGLESKLAIDTIATVWAKTDPASALNFAASQTGELASRLASIVFKQWASTDLNAASSWLAQTDNQSRTTLSPTLMESWAKQDASAALAWSENNLTGVQLAQAVTGVMNGAAAKDINAAATMVTAIPPGEARSEAAAVVAQKWLPGIFSGQPIPDEAVKWLSSLDNDSIKRVLAGITGTWASRDPQGMSRFLSAVSNDAVPDFSDPWVAREWARTDPKGALQWAATLPANCAVSAGAAAFAAWQQSQPEAANTWLNGLPNNDPRRQVFAKK
jgi:hypothetical protein